MITTSDLEFIKEYDWTMAKFVNSIERMSKYVNTAQRLKWKEIRTYRPTISFEVVRDNQ